MLKRKNPWDGLLTCQGFSLSDLLHALNTIKNGSSDEKVSDCHHYQTQGSYVLLLHAQSRTLIHSEKEILFI